MELAESTTRLLYVHEFGGAIRLTAHLNRAATRSQSARDCPLDLGRVLAAGGRSGKAREAMLQARAAAERKGNVGLIGVIDRHMEALRGQA